MCHDPGTKKCPLKIPAVQCQNTKPPDQKPKQKQYQKRSQDPGLLTHNGKNHIILGFRHKSQLLKAVSETFAKNPSASYGIQTLYGLKSFFIFFRIPPNRQTLQAVTFRSKKNRNKSNSCTSQSQKLQISGIGHKDQHHTDS